MPEEIIAARVKRIRPSPSVAARARVRELCAQGRDIVDFTIGEPDLETPDHIIEAANAAMRRGETKYPPVTGTPQLRKAISEKFSRENGLMYAPNQIVVGSGAKHIIFSALAATVEEGDEVIIPAPYWVSYPDMVLLNGGNPVIVRCPEERGFKLTAEALDRAITPRTKWVILNSPNNPSGAVYGKAEIADIVTALMRHPHVWLMTDDIYEHFIYETMAPVPALHLEPSLAARTLTVNGVSKAYAMTGWRIGYAGGPPGLISPIGTLLSQSTGGACSISQAAAVEALSGSQDCVKHALTVFSQRRKRAVELLGAVPGLRCSPPQGAFYAYPSCAGLIGAVTPDGQKLQNDLDVSLYLLEKAGVAVLDGAAYGLSPYLRLSFATSIETIERGCRRLREACSALVLPP